MKRVSGLHVVVSGLAGEEEETLPPKNGSPGDNGAGAKLLDRARLTRLLKERQYEEALEMLLKARQQSPDDPTISRSVRLLKDRLTQKYAEAVGSLDHVARCTIPDAELSSLALSFEDRGVLSLVDGIATFGDIVDASPHGRFATYRALAGFLEKGVVTRAGSDTAPIPAPVVAQRRPPLSPVATPPPPPLDAAPVLSPAHVPEGLRVTPPPPPKITAAVAVPERRPPTRFAETPWGEPAQGRDPSAPPVPDEPAPSRWVDEDEEGELGSPRNQREDTQPMFQMAALVAAGAVSSTLAPSQAPAPQPFPPQPLVPPPSPAEPVAPAPVSSRPAVDYDALFERATRAYVRRDYEEAITLFEEYLSARPADRRALHNLEQLRKRKKG